MINRTIRIIGLLTISALFIFSLSMNYIFYGKLNSEKERVNKVDKDISYLYNVIGSRLHKSNQLALLERTIKKTDSSNIMVDLILNKTAQMGYDLLAISGGQKENGDLWNGASIHYTKKYFFSENDINSYAENQFQESLLIYTQYMDRIGHKTNVSKYLNIQSNLENEPLFKEKNVSESMTMLNLISILVLMDQKELIDKNSIISNNH